MKAYAGIGSRETPKDTLYLIAGIAQELAYQGWILRSGCAPGADSAFEDGAFHARLTNERIARPELYLPWPGFEGRRRVLTQRERPQEQAYDIAAQFHPNWANLTNGAKALHARNVHQILGPDVTSPVLSRFVICWTKSGAGGGGTGQALRIARHYEVPIFDLAIANDHERVMGLFEPQ